MTRLKPTTEKIALTYDFILMCNKLEMNINLLIKFYENKPNTSIS